MARLKLTIAYDGTGFRGLAPNPGVRSVVGELQSALAPYLGDPPDIVMSGRTDAGVHSSGQVLSFHFGLRQEYHGRNCYGDMWQRLRYILPRRREQPGKCAWVFTKHLLYLWAPRW